MRISFHLFVFLAILCVTPCYSQQQQQEWGLNFKSIFTAIDSLSDTITNKINDLKESTLNLSQSFTSSNQTTTAATTTKTTTTQLPSEDFFSFFESRRAQFNLPTCLRNTADIIEELQQLNQNISLELSVEKAMNQVKRYTELLFSCGFAFQYQKFIDFFIASRKAYLNCANKEQTENFKPDPACFGLDSGESPQAIFVKRVVPCASRLREIIYAFGNITPIEKQVLSFPKLVVNLIGVEECGFSGFGFSSAFVDFIPQNCMNQLTEFSIIAKNTFKDGFSYASFFMRGPTLLTGLYDVAKECSFNFIASQLDSLFQSQKQDL